MNKTLRLFITLALWSLAPSSWAQTPATLTLAEALKLGLARPELRDIFEGRSDLAEGAVLQQQTLDNPELLMSTEHLQQAGLSSKERYLLLSQRVALFGIKGLRTQAARHQSNASQWGSEAQKLDDAANIKTLFYEVLFLQERIKIQETGTGQTQQIQEIIAQRERAGQVSGFDRRRLLRELADVRAELARDRAQHAVVWEQLRTALGLEGSYLLTGTLLPGPSAVGLDLAQRPKFLAFDEELKAAALEEKAAGHWQLPEITLEAGLKEMVVGPEKDTGFFISARLPLPVFNRNKAELMKARARTRIAAGEKALAQRETQGRIQALEKQIQLIRASIEDYEKDAIGASKELLEIAQAAYLEGELEILALLDAFQSSRDSQLRAVSMEADARRLMTELERLRGEQ